MPANLPKPVELSQGEAAGLTFGKWCDEHISQLKPGGHLSQSELIVVWNFFQNLLQGWETIEIVFGPLLLKGGCASRAMAITAAPSPMSPAPLPPVPPDNVVPFKPFEGDVASYVAFVNAGLSGPVISLPPGQDFPRSASRFDNRG